MATKVPLSSVDAFYFFFVVFKFKQFLNRCGDPRGGRGGDPWQLGRSEGCVCVWGRWGGYLFIFPSPLIRPVGFFFQKKNKKTDKRKKNGFSGGEEEQRVEMEGGVPTKNFEKKKKVS